MSLDRAVFKVTFLAPEGERTIALRSMSTFGLLPTALASTCRRSATRSVA